MSAVPTSKDLKTNDLSVSLDLSKAPSADELKPYIELQHAANYLAAAMIFLQSNALLRRELTKDDVKPRLLGHWGTCPGINLVYAHLTRLIKKQNLNMMLVTGPGHGAPAILGSQYLEQSITKYYPKYSIGEEGLEKLVRGFSWPGGFPSHINSETPGQIHEGGELGYALAVSFGAALDNPDLIVPCIVGDGEAETGPTATAWHLIKYLDPAKCGAVLPILHLNGFKIAERTISGTMSDDEVTALFTGYGYQVRIVGTDLDKIQEDMAMSFEWAIGEIHAIQKAARSGQAVYKPRWPVIVLRSPKGWTGPKKAHGVQIEGTWHAHQVPLPKAKTDDEEFQLLKQWLESYKPHELFDDNGRPIKEILDCFPQDERLRMGQRKETHGVYKQLKLPAWQDYVSADPDVSAMISAGDYLAEVCKNNDDRFRIFSPDELTSNKLTKVLEVTNRTMEWDPDLFTKGGRVTEVLSEHSCQGMLQGYTLTGRTGLFPSYEAFLGIITTMIIQYAKFLKLGKETLWQHPVPSINYIESSTLWRQEHNGFSHQNPAFLNNLMNLKSNMVRIYLPPDANCMLSTLDHCLKSKNYVNLIISAKNPMPVWLSSAKRVEEHCRAGVSVWSEFSTDGGRDPDVVLVGCGVETTFEVIAAAALLRKDCPKLRVRVVNVTDLMVLGFTHSHRLTTAEFDAIFTKDKPIIFNFHGYPSAIKSLAYDRVSGRRMAVHGYNEEGTTTTPFHMLTANGCSRYDIAIDALEHVLPNGAVDMDARTHIANYRHAIREHQKYIEAHGTDPKYLAEKPTFD
ncbi:phosphoketolase [Radiomyces spectabilis]|uniref:phosphoketolase n=1 Tax=Radiomyces spectabilis TaxID=64574 RepID=UPI0022205F61|nr:phosphoketolase [Radiomyces spectabilis]KAI8364734.1 phosphoketolase [Radiomyces spectabilis]